MRYTKSISGTAGIFFVMTTGLLSGQPTQSGISTPFTEMHGKEMAKSSAINVAMFCLRYLHKPVKVGSIARVLHAGAAWNNAVAPRAIGRLMRSEQLRVEAVRRSTFSHFAEILSGQAGKRIIITSLKHLGLAGDRSRHYIALLSSGRDGLYVVDPGTHIGWVSMAYLHDHLRQFLASNGMIVEPNGAQRNLKTYSPAARGSIVLNVGTIASGPGTVAVRFRVRNPLGSPISINFAKGTCFCFKRATIATPNHRIMP